MSISEPPHATSAAHAWRRPVSRLLVAYLILVGAHLCLLAWCARIMAEPGLVGVAATGLALMLPAVACRAYFASLRRIRTLQVFVTRSLFADFYAGYALRLLGSLVLAGWGALVLMDAMVTEPNWLWVSFATALVLWPLHWVALRRIGGSVQEWFRLLPSLTVAIHMTALLMTSVVLVSRLIASPLPAYPSLGEAIAAEQHYTGESDLLSALVNVMAMFDGLTAYGLSLLSGQGSVWALGCLMLSQVGTYAFLVALGSAFAAFLIPADEYRRIFAPPVPNTVPPKVPRRRIAATAAIAVIGIGFVYLPLLAQFDLALRSSWRPSPDAPPLVEELETLRIEAEKIGNKYYLPGTIAELEALQSKAIRDLEAERLAIEAEVLAAFSAMRGNVDQFLDWYYSLPAEYARTGHLLIGDFDQYIARQVQSHLSEGGPFDALEASLIEADAVAPEALSRFREAAAEVLRDRRVFFDATTDEPVVVGAAAEPALLSPAVLERHDLLGLPTRLTSTLAAGTVAGGLSAAVGAKVTTKLAAKGTLKLAAKAVVRMTGGKLASGASGGAAGALIGGTIGSVVPVLGTAVGAAVGGVLGGVIAGAGADYLLLRLEEQFGREAFRNEIMQVIDALEAESLATLRGVQPDHVQ